MTMGGSVKPGTIAIRPPRISQIASKIDPKLFVSLMLLTSVCEKYDPYCPASPVDLAVQQTSAAATLEQPHDDDEHDRAQKRD